MTIDQNDLPNEEQEKQDAYIKQRLLALPQPQHLRVWWVPQVPMQAFHVTVGNLWEAYLITRTLGKYDLFQFRNKVKPDYANAGGVQYFVSQMEALDDEENGWFDWCDEESGNDLDATVQELKEEFRNIQKTEKADFEIEAAAI